MLPARRPHALSRPPRMPVTAALERDPVVVGPLGGLLLSAVRANSPMLVVRAVRWWRDLARLGVHLPLFVVHDLGLLYAAPREQIELVARPGADAVAGARPEVSGARGKRTAIVVGEIAQSQAASRARGR